MEQVTAYLRSELFSSASVTAFAVLDGAAVPGLPAMLELYNPQHACLYRGDLSPAMAEVAPYLVVLEKDEPFTDWVVRGAWGRCWGIFGVTHAEFIELRRHFAKFVRVSDFATGKPLYFRFYDPMVLRIFLRVCDPDHRKALFGPVHWYIAEDVDRGNLEKFLLVDDALRHERISC